ncbi:hypothetical protein EJB05_42431, partial [Eragrostis curvula]
MALLCCPETLAQRTERQSVIESVRGFSSRVGPLSSFISEMHRRGMKRGENLLGVDVGTDEYRAPGVH